MANVQIPQETLNLIAEENAKLSMMAREMERVLDWYRDHPHYPLDFEKVKGRVVEVHTRLDNIATVLRKYTESTAPHD
jgi:hypothetical protein